jgi:hypothetical protein
VAYLPSRKQRFPSPAQRTPNPAQHYQNPAQQNQNPEQRNPNLCSFHETPLFNVLSPIPAGAGVDHRSRAKLERLTRSVIAPAAPQPEDHKATCLARKCRFSRKSGREQTAPGRSNQTALGKAEAAL